MSKKILVVDDDPDILLGLESRLQWLGYEVTTAKDGGHALTRIIQANPSLVLLDLELPSLSGLEILKRIQQEKLGPTVIMMTAFGTIDRAVEAMKLGAYDFITKPFNQNHLGLLIQKALEYQALKREVRYLRTEIESRYQTIIAESPVMKSVLESAKRAAETDAPILLLGETGTGKELLAHHIHQWSERRANSFMVINCAALPETLLENEIFGHEKGAFTGATSRAEGKIEAAEGGTVFLDEIGDLPLTVQGRFLRLLQDKEFYRVGGSNIVRVDVRFIAATNQNLSRRVREGGFREDLFFRLNVMPISIPALRNRIEDLPLLAIHILEQEVKKGKQGIKELQKEALDLMMNYHWPGNIRELENILTRAAILSTDKLIGPDLLGLETGPVPTPGEAVDALGSRPYHESMEAYSKRLILEALQQTGWNQTKAATRLQLQRTYFTKLLKKKKIRSNPPAG